MGDDYQDPWASTLQGPWTQRIERAGEPCHYCRQPAHMREPGKPWKAHKVCAQGNPSTGPSGTWDGVERESKLEPGPVGCGEPAPGQKSGRACAGTGAVNSCTLCPESPTYWRLSS